MIQITSEARQLKNSTNLKIYKYPHLEWVYREELTQLHDRAKLPLHVYATWQNHDPKLINYRVLSRNITTISTFNPQNHSIFDNLTQILL